MSDPALENYIDTLWEKLTRICPVDSGTLIGVPRPYIVPAVDPQKPLFQELYYWDSFFVSVGLRHTAHSQLVIDMTENFAYLIDRFGYIPNATRFYFLSRSQPPFFTRMIGLANDILTERGDPDRLSFLSRMYTLACREQEFWISTSAPYEKCVYQGLSRYSDVNYLDALASCESGWDHSTRCRGNQSLHDYGAWMRHLPVDLNSILLVRERDLARLAAECGEDAAAKNWIRKAEERSRVMQEIFWDEKSGFFFDFDFHEKQINSHLSLAGFFSLWAELATPEQAATMVREWLPRFLSKGGVVTALQHYPERQWAWPNGWAPLQWIVAQGLESYGYRAEARDIAQRWCTLCEEFYAKNLCLPEKFNVVNPETPPEEGLYGTVRGFGWTNGVYLDFKRRFLAEG